MMVDNNSSDQTSSIGQRLAADFPQLQYLFIPRRGKGAAIRAAWQKFNADIYCFMDVDLATDLSALPALIQGINEGNDLVIGSRFHSDALVKRALGRRLISYSHHLLIKFFLGSKISDTPCGFKAINHRVKNQLLPLVENQNWFFDSELVLLAEKKGYRFKEIPVCWQDFREGQDKSRVKVISLGLNYWREIIKIKPRLKL